jgi:hypothetical protein
VQENQKKAKARKAREALFQAETLRKADIRSSKAQTLAQHTVAQELHTFDERLQSTVDTYQYKSEGSQQDITAFVKATQGHGSLPSMQFIDSQQQQQQQLAVCRRECR